MRVTVTNAQKTYCFDELPPGLFRCAAVPNALYLKTTCARYRRFTDRESGTEMHRGDQGFTTATDLIPVDIESITVCDR